MLDVSIRPNEDEFHYDFLLLPFDLFTLAS
jgi:hypothetical protein